MWINAGETKPAESGWYLCAYSCSGHNGCGRKCEGVYLMRYSAELGNVAVYGVGCIYHGNVLYDVPVGGASNVYGNVTHWQPLPERP